MNPLSGWPPNPSRVSQEATKEAPEISSRGLQEAAKIIPGDPHPWNAHHSQSYYLKEPSMGALKEHGRTYFVAFNLSTPPRSHVPVA